MSTPPIIKAPKKFGDLGPSLPWLLLLVTVAVFYLLLYPRLAVKQPVYQTGDIAQRDIKATEDFLVEDQAATETNRTLARQNVLAVYDYDPSLADRTGQRVETAFEKMRLAIASQQATASDESVTQTQPPQATPPAETGLAPSPDLQQQQVDLIWSKKKEFEEDLGIAVSQGAFTILVEARFSEAISGLIVKILSEIMNNGVVANKEILLKESEKGIMLRTVGIQSARAVQNLRQFYGPDQAKSMVRIIGQPLVGNLNYNLINLVVDLAQRLLQPNISLNLNETEERKKRAAEEIKPILYKIKSGEMLVREGERISETQLIKLKAMNEQAQPREVFSTIFGAVTILICFILTAYHLTVHSGKQFHVNYHRNLLFLVCMLLLLFVIVKFGAILAGNWSSGATSFIPAAALLYGLPLTFAAMTVGLFLYFETALFFSMVVAISTAILLQNHFEFFLYFFLSSILSAYLLRNCRERKSIIFAGAKLGLFNLVYAMAIDLYLSDPIGFGLMWNWAFAFMGGLGAAIITVGFAPLVEIAFHYTTDITLLELANLDRPLMRQLMIQAPGTYHHSVVVGSLVEAAASEIGANPLLSKACGYYHDIGKINKPLYYIENQTDGKNKHDKLAPSMSGLILIAHVKDGVEIAKKNKLGEVIIDSIRQHHGTSLISYFYEKAKQLKGEGQVKIEDFRYPGPKPQTKEAGLVMLADVVEAASRTLENPTPSRIQGLVQYLINKVFSDGQLDDCELTLKDLHSIAKSFNKMLYGIHHHRIEYAESTAKKSEKASDESSDRQPASQLRNIDKKSADEGKGHLKRLGMS
jgi:putative nucleotidyltransferase with HDIG domain